MDIVRGLLIGTGLGVVGRQVLPRAGLGKAVLRAAIRTPIILIIATRRFGAEIVEQVEDIAAEARHEMALAAAEARDSVDEQ